MTDIKDIVDKKVLIFEDDTFLGSIILRHMISHGIKARLIVTGDKAIEVIKQDIPDIIILDIFLPVLNGIEILKMLRKDESIKKIPVLVVSNTNKPDELKLIKNLGAKFILKALANPDNILDEVKEILLG